MLGTAVPVRVGRAGVVLAPVLVIGLVLVLVVARRRARPRAPARARRRQRGRALARVPTNQRWHGHVFAFSYRAGSPTQAARAPSTPAAPSEADAHPVAASPAARWGSPSPPSPSAAPG